MSTKGNNIITQNKDIASVFVVVAAILMIPLMGMQFTTEVRWDLSDFAIMGILMTGTGLLIVLAARKLRNANYRAAVIVALLAAFLLVWAELAVGIFGTPFAGS